jgi:hypothetical protein
MTVFRQFLTDLTKRMNLNLQSNTDKTVDMTWGDLYEETRYFQNKISMYHVDMTGQYWFLTGEQKKIVWSWNLDSTHSLYGYKGLVDVTSVSVVKSLHNKFTELCVCIENLYYIRKTGWTRMIM